MLLTFSSSGFLGDKGPLKCSVRGPEEGIEEEKLVQIYIISFIAHEFRPVPDSMDDDYESHPE